MIDLNIWTDVKKTDDVLVRTDTDHLQTYLRHGLCVYDFKYQNHMATYLVNQVLVNLLDSYTIYRSLNIVCTCHPMYACGQLCFVIRVIKYPFHCNICSGLRKFYK